MSYGARIRFAYAAWICWWILQALCELDSCFLQGDCRRILRLYVEEMGVIAVHLWWVERMRLDGVL
jgi:hypothetical protein